MHRTDVVLFIQKHNCACLYRRSLSALPLLIYCRINDITFFVFSLVFVILISTVLSEIPHMQNTNITKILRLVWLLWLDINYAM